MNVKTIVARTVPPVDPWWVSITVVSRDGTTSLVDDIVSLLKRDGYTSVEVVNTTGDE